MTNRDFQETTVLIPGYSIEDLPTDLNEGPAASLLNAIAVAWHPQLLVLSGGIPQFRQADSTEMPTAQQFILIPECSAEWLDHDWQQKLEDTLSVFIHNCSSRDEWLTAIHEALELQQDLPAEVLNQFCSLGTCYLQVMLLSRKMHFFVDPDAYVLESEAIAAAQAAMNGDSASMREHLQRCFECLQECREQFQPTDCYLLDMCLPSEQTSAEELETLIQETNDLTLVCSGQELRAHVESSETLRDALKKNLEDRKLSLMVGHHHELRTSLGSLSTLYSDVEQAHTWLQTLGELEHFHWARRRFGMASVIPAVVALFELRSALHVALDDGIYPDREQGQMRWSAPDGTSVPAVSRIPMAIDGASAFLRFADRFTESMQEDNSAVMLLARLPQVQSPWLQDLRIAASYAPVLGQFVTMTEFVDLTDGQGSPTQYDDGEYLSPYLIQSSVLKTEAPISSPAALHQLRARLESVCSLSAIAGILRPSEFVADTTSTLEGDINEEEARRLAFDSESDLKTQEQHVQEFSEALQAAQDSRTESLLQLIPGESADVNGICVFNTLPWKRRQLIHWPDSLKPPAESQAIIETQRQNGFQLLTEVPAGGFVWLTEAADNKSAARPASSKGKPLAEGMLLRNQIFEVQLSETTGGIASVTFHNQRTNRVSQQLAFRYEHSKTCMVNDQEVTTSYAVPQLVAANVTQSGPVTGEIKVTGEIRDVADNDVMATFHQTVTVSRNSGRLKIRIEFDDIRQQPAGNPWMTYFASRFAWENEAASITRGMLGQARGFRMERFEAPDYVEVADTDTRMVIVPHGRPYHRRSGHRMLDSLLLVEGETTKTFDFILDFDQTYPMRVAAEVQQPLITCDVDGRKPAAAETGWILGLSAKNVIVARIRTDRMESRIRVLLLLEETEGRRTSCVIRTARKPRTAREANRHGTTTNQFDISETGVAIEFQRFQIREVELTF